MATSAIPVLIDALVTQATAALTDRLVIDGFGVTDDANPNILMVGVDDPGAQTSAQSSETSQEAATLGTNRSRDQRGAITCAALSWTGDTSTSNQKAARDAVYATLAAVENILRTDPSLGVTGFPLLVCQLGDERLSQNQYEDGCDALLIFTVNFRARL